MNKRHLTIAAAVAAFSLTAAVRGASLSVTAGQTHVTATAVAPSVFRISLNTVGPAAPIASQYLDPSTKAGDLGTVSEVGGHQRLTTPMGALDIDSAAGTYSLLDAKGAVLTPPAALASGGATTANVHVGWPAGKPFAVYGCGNGADALVQHSVKAHVANGIAVQPFCWSPAGYATFVVGADDAKPAQCDGKVANGSVTWAVPGASADLYLIVAPTLGDASRGLLGLTGRPPVPPRWTFGYLQSRWGWRSRADVTDTLKQFEIRRLPVDAFIFDFEWYTKFPDYDVKREGEPGFGDFGWNDDVFPAPAEQLKQLHDAGVKFVGIRKPRLGDRDTLAMIRSKGWDFRGGTWYDARDLRYDVPALRDWYAQQTVPLLKAGVDGWWDDEGEYTFMTYAFWNAAERQALDAVNPKARLWTLNRAFQPGTARLGAAAWTGDILATWDDFRNTPTALLNWSVAGMPFATCDIGGFHGETTPELLTRWLEAGAFFPIMRTHSEVQAKPHFPWAFGDQAEGAIRKALELRYRLVPTLYSLAHMTHETGEPVMRPLVAQYPTDPKVADLSSEWLVGQDLLAAPVLEQGGRRSIYLPDDVWYEFATGARVTGGRAFDLTVPFDAVPAYVRAGAILPLAPIVQHTRDLPGGPLDLHVYAGRDGHFTLVEDDGDTTAYTTGAVRKTAFTWNDATRTLSWTCTGSYDGPTCFRSVHVTVHGGPTATADKPLAASGSATFGE